MPETANDEMVADVMEQIKACCQALDDKKAEDLKVLRLGPLSSITDYFIIATGTSDPHLKALGGTVQRTLKDLQVDTLASDRSTHSGWYVVDAYDFMVHLFTKEKRAFFNLEGLWKDAEQVDVI